jgi:hypothetical protein
MKNLLYAYLLFLCPFYLGAQANDEYKKLIKQAETYYNNKQYKESAEIYQAAFKSGSGDDKRILYVGDIYNAACSMAQAGMTDSAFYQLNIVAAKGSFSDYGHIIGDSDLVSLHGDNRWDAFCKKVKENKDKKEANLNKPLVAILDTVYTDDQVLRPQFEEAIKKFGFDSKEAQDLRMSIKLKDSINIIKVEKILDQYGWLGADVIGSQGSRTIFLVIQHAHLETQEKYLPMMREAVKNKKTGASSLALLEDRVALGEGKKQIYGSQIASAKDGSYYIRSLDDPDNVDKRRAAVGLGPLADYVQRWNLKWDPEEYKKQLPEIQKKEKETFGN